MTEEAQELVSTLSVEIINPIIYLMFAAALVYFIFGVVKYIANADNETEREKGRQHILYSIVGLVIMMGVWGILQIIANTLGPQAQIPSDF